ncbi:hypothetical protein TIFTF001_038517 [Ficus carica]|uniref:Uncharacterized protein n=1 Tax=Ficus carica TaxID=3494 RepID=A0AA88JA02_FICCA|nr:hypothetical protein TIFTF001_038517 [Ficus carica]
MFTNNKNKVKNDIRISKHDGKQACLCRTDPSKVGLDYGFSWKWFGRPNHSIVARPLYLLSESSRLMSMLARRVVIELVSERFPAIRFHSMPAIATIIVDADREAISSFYEARPLYYDGTRQPVSLAAWLHDMELIFHLCHIEASLRVSLACRCLVADARLWWLTIGERALLSRTWADFRTLMIERFGPLPGEGADAPYRDPEIYRDMRHARYVSFLWTWHAYPQESMGHYYRRFQEEMLPYIPQDIDSPEMQALVILRNGLLPQIRQFAPALMRDMTIGHMIDGIMEVEITAHAMQADAFVGEHPAPVDDAGIGEPIYEPGLVLPEDPIPAVPLPEIPAQEAEEGMDADAQDADDLLVAPDDQLEDPPVIDISSDEEEPEPELEHAGWLEDEEDFEDDPEKILFHDGDWEADSDASSVVTIEYID